MRHGSSSARIPDASELSRAGRKYAQLSQRVAQYAVMSAIRMAKRALRGSRANRDRSASLADHVIGNPNTPPVNLLDFPTRLR